MKEPCRIYAAVLVALAVVWIISAPTPLLAQRPYPPPKANKVLTPAPPIGGDPRGQGAGASENSRRDETEDTATMLLRRRLAAELAEDFDRLRRINTEKLSPLASSESLDYRELSQAAGEINKRAKRIKSNSPLLLKEKKVETASYQEDAAALGSMLPELSRMINSFLGSSIFRVASINDDERSTAGRNLEGIIRLSETINKIAKRLAKTSTRSA